MKDWKTLGISKTSDWSEALKAFIENVKEVDFDKDIDLVFSNLKAYLNISRQLYTSPKHSENERSIPEEHEQEGVYKNPDDLIARFKTIYSQPSMRFDLVCWKSAIGSAKQQTEVPLQEYQMPIIEFLSGHVLLKSDVLMELGKSFQFVKLFQSREWVEVKKQHESYAYIEYLLMRGNFEMDLAVDSLVVNQYEPDQLDTILGTLSQSYFLIRKKDYINAFNVLTQIPKEVKPLMVWQRMLNILYRATVIDKQEEPRNIFVSILNECLQLFPGDTHIIYLRCAFIFATQPPDEAKNDLIKTLKINPTNLKLYYLLGKCYLNLKSYENAHTIFKWLFDLNPKNLEYSAYAAVAIDGLREQQAKADTLERDLSYYKKRITQLLDLHIYDEINVPAQYEQESDLQALMLYAQASEMHYYEGKTEPDLLYKALEYAQDDDVVLRIVRKLFEFYPNFDDHHEIKDLIFSYLEKFPEDYATNFKAGSYYFAVEDYKKALSYYEKSRELNPQNIYSYLGVARAAEFLKEYTKAIEAISIFLQEEKYDARGYEILGRCQFNVGNFYQAYESFRWIINTQKPRPSANSINLMVRSLVNHIKELDDSQRHSAYIQNEINETIKLFDSLEKDDDFRTLDIGRSAFYHAAKLCEHVNWNEKGLEFIEAAIKQWTSKGSQNLGDYAGMKAQFMIALGKNQETVEFLEPYVTYLENFKEKDHWRLSICCYHLAVANINLDKEEEAYRCEQLAIDHYAMVKDFSQSWLEDYIFTVFDKCVMFSYWSRIKETGHKYLKLISASTPNHVFVSFWLGKTYEEEGDKTTSQKYFQDCKRYGEQFPESYRELTEDAEKLMN